MCRRVCLPSQTRNQFATSAPRRSLDVQMIAPLRGEQAISKCTDEEKTSHTQKSKPKRTQKQRNNTDAQFIFHFIQRGN